MDAKKKYSILIGIFIGINVFINAQEIPGNIVTGLGNGNAEMVANYFESTVELIINNKENIYSSKQAQIILKDFFKKNPPKSFSILHEGGKESSKYAIGNLISSQGKYRITILLKQNNNKPYIHQLRIEKDED